ncbi:MAG TPA: hypothetical protein VK178_07225 [Opitutaceae bacterium]|nr:hypothetical protein [Opitutaceae bacterium]
MPPTPQAVRCEQHTRDIDEMRREIDECKRRLDDGSQILKAVREIRIAVCGDETLGIKGLVTLHERVQSLERGRAWLLGAGATAGFALGTLIPLGLQLFSK